MRCRVLIFVLLTALLGGVMDFASAKERKVSNVGSPNIVLIVVDNMGWQDTSLPFWYQKTPYNGIFKTPNMERLASEGVKFTRAYSCQLSTPSKISLLTGMSPATHRITGWLLHRDVKPEERKYGKLILPLWNINGLQPGNIRMGKATNATLLPEVLKRYGYTTIHCGNSWYGAEDTPGAHAKNLGYDISIMEDLDMYRGSYLKAERLHKRPSERIAKSEQKTFRLERKLFPSGAINDHLTDSAIMAMDRAMEIGSPFFLHLNYYSISPSFKVDNARENEYKSKGLNANKAHCAVQAEDLDRGLGRILDYLRDNQLKDNTMVIFLSENGGFNLNVNDEGFAPNIHNYPLSAGKGSVSEGGVRVPFIIRMPYKVAVKECESPIHVMDIMPTILEFVGIKKARTIQRLEGVSLMPCLGAEASGGGLRYSRPIFFHFPNRWGGSKEVSSGSGYGMTSAVVSGDWKLIYYYESGRVELYNLKDDIFEIVNQADNSDAFYMRKRLTKELSKHLRRTKAQLPQKDDGTWCRYPDGKAYRGRGK